jgi:uncharacterized protein YbjT (DUF2867 family)
MVSRNHQKDTSHERHRLRSHRHGRQTRRLGTARRGHAVTGFARHPEKLGLDHPNSFPHHAGDALNAADVSGAVKGQDAVLVVLGAGMSRKSRIRSEGTLNVIRAMQAHGPRG